MEEVHVLEERRKVWHLLVQQIFTGLSTKGQDDLGSLIVMFLQRPSEDLPCPDWQAALAGLDPEPAGLEPGQ